MVLIRMWSGWHSPSCSCICISDYGVDPFVSPCRCSHVQWIIEGHFIYPFGGLGGAQGKGVQKGGEWPTVRVRFVFIILRYVCYGFIFFICENV